MKIFQDHIVIKLLILFLQLPLFAIRQLSLQEKLSWMVSLPTIPRLLCGCSLTSTESTSVSFTPLNSIQPNYPGGNSVIRVRNGGTDFTINCYVSGTITVSPSDNVTLDFERPLHGYNSDYCMLLTPGISNRQKKLKTKKSV